MLLKRKVDDVVWLLLLLLLLPSLVCVLELLVCNDDCETKASFSSNFVLAFQPRLEQHPCKKSLATTTARHFGCVSPSWRFRFSRSKQPLLLASSKRKVQGDTKNNNKIVVKKSKRKSDSSSNCATDTTLCLRFSHSFQRHVVYRPRRGRVSRMNSNTTTARQEQQDLFCNPDNDCDEVVASFMFLDEARAAYPQAQQVILPEATFDVREPEVYRSIVAGAGLEEGTAYRGDGNSTISMDDIANSNRTQAAYETLLFLSSLAWSCGQAVFGSPVTTNNKNAAQRGQDYIASMLADRVGKRRFLTHSTDSIRNNYNRLMDLLTRGNSTLVFPTGLALDERGARRVICNFPQLCLYNYHDVEERIQFLLAPLPPKYLLQNENNNKKNKNTLLDWPRLSNNFGLGAGLTVQQATDAIRVVPQLLAMHHDDAMKPSFLHFYQSLQLSFETCDEARAELDTYLTGATAADIWTFAYLHSIGVSWDQIKILLEAFPTIVFCDVEPNWELVDQGNVRSVLKEADLNYLQKRLQIGPSEVFAMIKTHSRLSSYSTATKIKPNLDAIQSRVGFSSSELRKVILRMPSLIGMSVKHDDSGLNQRLNFFLQEVGMSRADLRKAVLKQPSLLHYSVDSSLRPKIEFLEKALGVPFSSISRVITTCPSVLGLSLANNLRPTTKQIMERCGLSKDEMGDMIVRVPQILISSWKRKLEPTLLFLTEHLNLSKQQLRDLVKTTPRTLIHSVESSLQPNLRMIQTALEHEAAVAALESEKGDGAEFFPLKKLASTVVIENPSLLVANNDILKQRLGIYIHDPDTKLSDALQPRAGRANGQPRTKRSVLQISPESGRTLRKFSSVQSAAQVAGSSVPNMYHAIRNGRLIKGEKYIYGAAGKPPKVQQSAPLWDKDEANSTTSHGHDSTSFSASATKIKAIHKRKVVPSAKQAGLVRDIHKSTYQVREAPGNINSTVASLHVFVSGRVYPPDDIHQVRGTRRAGGFSVYFPQVMHSGSVEFSTRLRRATDASFGSVMPGSEGGSNFTDGTILAGFPQMRPSRNRCGLYACHGALKVILQLLKQQATTINNNESNLLEDVHFDIVIHTDSDYAWNLLRNETRLLQWGSFLSRDDFVYDGDGPLSMANPDLLYPLARTYYRVVKRELVNDKTGQPLMIGKRVQIKFRHSSETWLELSMDRQQQRLRKFAGIAARWQYNRFKVI